MIREEGYQSLFKGNNTYSFKVFSQFMFKVLLLDRLKDKSKTFDKYLKSKNLDIFGTEYIVRVGMTFWSSFLSVVFTYPFDMAYTRIAGSMNRYNQYVRAGDAFHVIEVQNPGETPKSEMKAPSRNPFAKYYGGMSVALYQAVLYSTITLTGYQLLHYSMELKNINETMKETNYLIRYIKTFAATSGIGLLASVITYPLDTLKRQMQVNGARGYALIYLNVKEGLRRMASHPTNFYK